MILSKDDGNIGTENRSVNNRWQHREDAGVGKEGWCMKSCRLMRWDPADWLDSSFFNWTRLMEEKEERKRRRKTERGRKKRTHEMRKQKFFSSNQSPITWPLFFFLKEESNNLNRVTLRRMLAMEMNSKFWGGHWEGNNLMAYDEEGDGLFA